ncbi:MAG: efflux RND transporter permease subunit [SAR202 cluster bacterium]|nr:efflux RND transporter permease subunit [SAR202 cluster bacterium]
MLTRLALRARVLTLVLTAAVIAGGAFSLSKLQLELLPDFDFPLVTVAVFYPEADAQTVLNDVTIPIERALDDVGEAGRVTTISAPSLSQIIIESDFGVDMEALQAEIERKVNAISFPQGVQPARVARINPDEFPIIQLSVLGERDLADLEGIINDRILPAIQSVEGVYSAEAPLGAGSGLSITRTNGLPSIPISVLKHPDANTVDVANRVTERLEIISPTLPQDIQLVEVLNQAPDVEHAINDLTRDVVIGSVLTVIIIFSFLLSVRPTIVTAVSIPVSIFAAFIAMAWQGMSLNILTLGGLAIAVGRVVDDSIVVMENVYRHIQMGEDRRTAALNATREVAMPITASTLTTIAVFAPLALIGGFISIIFVPFALTITYALVASLVVALTITPVLGTLLITKTEKQHGGRMERTYTGILSWALQHKALTLSIAGALFIGSLALTALVPMSFLPSSGNVVLNVNVTVPGAQDSGQVMAQLSEVEGVLGALKARGDVEVYQSTYGASTQFGAGGTRSDSASVQVTLVEGADADAIADELETILPGPSRSITVTKTDADGFGGNLLELTLLGEDYARMSAAADTLTAEIAKLEGTENVAHDGIAPAPGFEGMTPVKRVDGRRAITISGTITAKNPQALQAEVKKTTDAAGLPPGVELATGGVFEDMNEAFAQMGIAMLAGIVLVYVIMVVTQRSFVSPFVIIVSLPLASIGAIGGLFVTQRALGLPALMGILMLIGLVVTNAIVLIAFVEDLRKRGLTLRDALVQGGRTRLRPILMTALTTVFVLLPLSLGLTGGGSGIIGAELATVVVGGLITSTFLTLVVVPVIYSLLRRKGPKVPDGVGTGEAEGMPVTSPAAH